MSHRPASPALLAALGELSALLRLEVAETRRREGELRREGASLKQLEREGVVLRAAPLLEDGAAMFGRYRLVLGEDPSRPGQLRRFRARPGAIVRIASSQAEDAAVGEVRGIVARATAQQLTVVFDRVPAVGEGGESNGQVSLQLCDDEVTLERMQKVVREAEGWHGETRELLEVLLGLRATGGSDPASGPSTEEAPPTFDPALNEAQLEAVALAAEGRRLSLVHGPFGTGKTRVLVEIVRAAVAQGQRALCLSSSNAAADNIALALLERPGADADSGLTLARAGDPARVHPLLEAHTLRALTERSERRRLARELVAEAQKHLARLRRSGRGAPDRSERRELRQEVGRLFADARRLEAQAANEVLRGTQVVCGTLTGAPRELERRGEQDAAPFDLLVVDEATQALTPALLMALPLVRRVVLAGDHRQLPPTILSPEAARRGLAETVFEQHMEGRTNEAAAPGHMLTVQHRMSEALMAFPSAQFYDDKLTAHPSVAEQTLPSDEQPFELVDTAGAGFEERREDGGESTENPEQAALTAKIVRELLSREALGPGDIGVIAPYAAQVAVLHTLLGAECEAGLEIDSVDAFQGREKAAVVFDAVRSNDEGTVGFLADARRLNVAISRARLKLVVIADSATLGRDPVWGALIDAATAAGAWRSAFELL